ncbi:MAG: ATP-dependent metallopeptidase FtsH/Yme1/Tma family protein, partial [Myxococcota bacterium]
MSPPGKINLPRIVLPLLLLGGLVVANAYAKREARIEEVPYSAFLNHLEKDKLQKVEIRGRLLIADLKAATEAKPERIRTIRLPGIDESKLVEQLSAQGVEFVGRAEEPSIWPMLLGWLVPLSILFGLYFILFRRISKNMTGSGGPFGVGKSRAKRFDATEDT